MHTIAPLSVVLKRAPFRYLRPFREYIPVSLANLPARIQWALNNTAASQRIAQAGLRAAAAAISSQAIYSYWLALLHTYARLQRFAPGELARGMAKSLCTCWNNPRASPSRVVLPGARHCGLLCDPDAIKKKREYSEAGDAS